VYLIDSHGIATVFFFFDYADGCRRLSFRCYGALLSLLRYATPCCRCCHMSLCHPPSFDNQYYTRAMPAFRYACCYAILCLMLIRSTNDAALHTRLPLLFTFTCECCLRCRHAHYGAALRRAIMPLICRHVSPTQQRLARCLRIYFRAIIFRFHFRRHFRFRPPFRFFFFADCFTPFFRVSLRHARFRLMRLPLLFIDAYCCRYHADAMPC